MSKFLNGNGVLYLWKKIKTYVTQQVSEAGHIKKEIVSAIPSVGEAKDNVIYMVAKKTANGNNAYDEYMLVNGEIERIGDTQAVIDILSDDDIDALINEA